MPNHLKITCFTDLKGSTESTEKLGHDIFLPEIKNHLEVGRLLAEICGGTYIKNIGDANMVTFETLEASIQYTSMLQNYCDMKPALRRIPMGIRVGLYLGVVEPTSDDVFGSGVNQAARVQGRAEPGQVVVDQLLVNSIKKLWGPQKISKYFTSLGFQTLKGIQDPAEQELFAFDWQLYTKDYPEDGLPRLVYDHLQQASIEPNNLAIEELGIPGLVIWPVVPRDLATAIHRGQAEIIRLLALVGWTIHLLVVDCGAKTYERSYSDAFCNRLTKYLSTRGVEPIQITYMSDLYNPDHPNYDRIQLKFRTLASYLSLDDLLAINNKDYGPDILKEIRNEATLDFLRPALATAAVLVMADNEANKCIVVAGFDEKIQWESAVSFAGTRNKLGVLMNPILKLANRYQGRQRKDWPIWNSTQALVREMEETNLGWWVFNLHAYLPTFPSNTVEISSNKISAKDWPSETVLPNNIRKEDLARQVWKLLDPGL